MGADSLVAVGGGSVMDTAKAVGIIIANPDFADVVSLEGVADTKNKSVPLIALPTTSGTAAEVTINYVITDEANKKKMVCVDPKDIPVVAIVDSDLMMGMPKGLCASTGMDALTHAIEGYITKGAWELSDMVELRAIELIAGSLYDSVQGRPQGKRNYGTCSVHSRYGILECRSGNCSLDGSPSRCILRYTPRCCKRTSAPLRYGI